MQNKELTFDMVDKIGEICDNVNTLNVIYNDFAERYFVEPDRDEEIIYFRYERIQAYLNHFTNLIYDIDKKISKLYLDITSDESVSNSQSIANLE